MHCSHEENRIKLSLILRQFQQFNLSRRRNR